MGCEFVRANLPAGTDLRFRLAIVTRGLRQLRDFSVARGQRRSAGRPDGRRRRRLHLRQVQRRRRPQAGPQDGDGRFRPVGEGGEPVPDRRDPVDQGRGGEARDQAPDHQRRVGSEQGDLRHQGDDRPGRPGADHLPAQLRGPRPGARLRQVEERPDHDHRPVPDDQDRLHRLHRMGRLATSSSRAGAPSMR